MQFRHRKHKGTEVAVSVSRAYIAFPRLSHRRQTVVFSEQILNVGFRQRDNRQNSSVRITAMKGASVAQRFGGYEYLVAPYDDNRGGVGPYRVPSKNCVAHTNRRGLKAQRNPSGQ